jgi:hypothetical protein
LTWLKQEVYNERSCEKSEAYWFTEKIIKYINSFYTFGDFDFRVYQYPFRAGIEFRNRRFHGEKQTYGRYTLSCAQTNKGGIVKLLTFE